MHEAASQGARLACVTRGACGLLCGTAFCDELLGSTITSMVVSSTRGIIGEFYIYQSSPGSTFVARKRFVSQSGLLKQPCGLMYFEGVGVRRRRGGGGRGGRLLEKPVQAARRAVRPMQQHPPRHGEQRVPDDAPPRTLKIRSSAFCHVRSAVFDGVCLMIRAL